LEVLKEGSTINHIEVAEVDWNVPDGWNILEYERSESSLSGGGYNMAKCMRSVTEPNLCWLATLVKLSLNRFLTDSKKYWLIVCSRRKLGSTMLPYY